MALGLLWAYVDFPIPIYATIWIILIAYVTRFLPYGLRAVTSTIIQVHKELEEASVACGAGFLATFRRVLIPMMRPGVMAGWIILVTIFMREFSATLFLYSPGSEPLGPLLYFLYLDGMRGRVAAIGLDRDRQLEDGTHQPRAGGGLGVGERLLQRTDLRDLLFGKLRRYSSW